MKTKKAYCPTCSRDDRNPTWEASWKVIATDNSCDLAPIWECRCCHRVEPRRVRATQHTDA